jgi:hypothetical protein
MTSLVRRPAALSSSRSIGIDNHSQYLAHVLLSQRGSKKDYAEKNDYAESTYLIVSDRGLRSRDAHHGPRPDIGAGPK